MKFFNLSSVYPAVLKLVDERTAEIFVHPQIQHEVDSMMDQIEPLRKFDTPLFTEARIKFFFPETSRIAETTYNDIIIKIDDITEKANVVDSELNSMTEADVFNFLREFPTRNSLKISYGDIRTLLAALSELDEVQLIKGNTQMPDNPLYENAKTVYTLLRSAEINHDNSFIKKIVKSYKG